MDTVRKALSLLTPREKRSGLLILLLAFVKALADMAGVAAVVPFLSVLGNPDLVRTNPLASAVYERMGFQTVEGFLLASGAVLILLLVLSAIIRSFAVYAINRWANMRGHGLSRRLLESYLVQPYVFFLNRHSAELVAMLMQETQKVVSNVFRPLGELLSAGLSFTFIGALVLWKEPVLTLVAVATIAGAYVALFFFQKMRMTALAETLLKSNRARYKYAWEALGGIKQIKLIGRERSYLEAFSAPSLEFARANSVSATMRQVPKFALETLAAVGIVALTLALLGRSGGIDADAIGQALPVLGLFAFAGYRMLPTFQSIYSAVSLIRVGAPAVDAVHDAFASGSGLAKLPVRPPQPLGLRKSIELRDVTFRYPGAKEPSLRKLSISLERGTTLGIVGPTGSGKSTLTDVLLGLLEPETGQLVVDGKVIDGSNVRAWRASVGYVPQQIFIGETDVAGNIAFGIPPVERSQERLLQAAEMAHIRRFILEDLPEGFATRVGEAGVKLSGGERQRIGIARALYSDPDVVVFDEATSALDNLTERRIIDDIGDLSGQKTVVMVAHRLSTVRHCDAILVMSGGRMVGFGTYDELNASNMHFRSISMAGAKV